MENHYLDQFGISYTVAGDVTNTETDIICTEVDGIFYYKQGRVIDVTSTYPPQGDLNPGQSTPFQLAGYPEGAHKITSFKVLLTEANIRPTPLGDLTISAVLAEVGSPVL